MADLGDTKTLKAIGVANNKLLDIRGGYNVMNNEPDDPAAWQLREQCLALANRLLELNESLGHRCHSISRAKMAEDPADDMFRDDGKGEKPVGQARGKGGVLAALSSTAFLEGQQAFGKGKNQTDNPYEREDPLRAEWDSGFTQAKEEFEE